MIIGLGSDLCNIERIQAALDRHGGRFEKRCFTETEQAKAAGRPWDAAKGFDQSAPVGSIRLGPLPETAGAIALSVNDERRQASTLDRMIWSPAEVVAQASVLWRLAPGDLIFTGTPEGVGAVQRGDVVVAEIDGLQSLTFTLV